jgi:uncharacterized linocin/CFP29 family protein
MGTLFRHLAPISEAAWAEIDEEAKRTLKASLAGRKLVDFTGPLGACTAAVTTGRAKPVSAPLSEGVKARLRQSQPLVELRVPFELSRTELDAIDHGAKDADLDPVIHAAQRVAAAEDRAIFHGYAAAAITGICQAAPNTVSLPANFEDYPLAVAEAIARLHAAGVDGPYAIALSRRAYVGLTEARKDGYPILPHVRRLLDGPIVWAPALDGAVVLSTRGGDFELTVGEDLSIGFLDHTDDMVRLYLEESFTFRVLSPQAAVALSSGSGTGAQKKKR